MGTAAVGWAVLTTAGTKESAGGVTGAEEEGIGSTVVTGVPVVRSTPVVVGVMPVSPEGCAVAYGPAVVSVGRVVAGMVDDGLAVGETAVAGPCVEGTDEDGREVDGCKGAGTAVDGRRGAGTAVAGSKVDGTEVDGGKI